MSELDDLLSKSYDTETIKDSFQEIILDASIQEKDIIPRIDSLNESLQNTLAELLKSIKEEKTIEENLKNSLEFETVKLKEVENQVEAEMEKAKNLNIEIEFLKEVRTSEEKQMDMCVRNCTSVLKEIADSYNEAPQVYADEVLKNEVSQLREKAGQAREALASMEREISMLKVTFQELKNEDLSCHHLKSVMKSSGDADFMESWLAQKNNEWIKENETLSAKLSESDAFIYGDGSIK